MARDRGRRLLGRPLNLGRWQGQEDGVFNVVYDGRFVTYHYMSKKEKEALIELWEA